jgi:hypothetical protein
MFLLSNGSLSAQKNLTNREFVLSLHQKDVDYLLYRQLIKEDVRPNTDYWLFYTGSPHNAVFMPVLIAIF